MKKFTLLELLIVIAVIGILLSILLPSLSRARLKAKRAVCLSNLKQLSIAQTSYSTANNGRLAVSSRGISWTSYSNVSLHAWSKDVFDPFKEKYLNGNVEAFICPLQGGSETWWEYNAKADGRLSSYMSATNECLSTSTAAGMSAQVWQKDNENYNVEMLSKVEDTEQMLFADLIRYNPVSASWGLADKNYKNGNPEGGNELQVNGTARWITFKEKQLNYKHNAWPYYWNDPR